MVSKHYTSKQYIDSQFEFLSKKITDYPAILKISRDGTATHWIDISDAQVEKIKNILKEEAK